jgi:hypothetical protein
MEHQLDLKTEAALEGLLPEDDPFAASAADAIGAPTLLQEIAERRAQLECAETLRRGRAL